MNTQPNQQKGFTIIEVVLVLAIAGLIFLMIFIAWPALQKNQRDTARKNDVAVVATALGTWKSNHKGTLPSSGATGDFITEFLPDYVPSLSQYTPASDVEYKTNPISDISTSTESGSSNNSTISIDKMWVFQAAKCTDDGVAGSSSRQVAIVAVIESGPENGTLYCQEG